MIARRTPTALKIMRDLWTCPDDVREVVVERPLTRQIPECAMYKVRLALLACADAFS